MTTQRRRLFLLYVTLSMGSAHATNDSPHVGGKHVTRVPFGDTRLHTAYSRDAGMIGTRLGPEKACRFALGTDVVSNTGLQARLPRPLHSLVISERAENLGLAPAIMESNRELLASAFDPAQKAMYDVRVIESPTPRWTIYDAKASGTAPPKEAPTSIQNRAYTSAVWVN